MSLVDYVLQKDGQKVFISNDMIVQDNEGNVVIDLGLSQKKNPVVIKANVWIVDFLNFSDSYRTAKKAIDAYIENTHKKYAYFELEKDIFMLETVKEEFESWHSEDEAFLYYEDDLELLFGKKGLN